MSRAETALDERAESNAGKSKQPKPGKYRVKSTGAPKEVPPEADLDIEGAGLSINGQARGPIESLPNGDFRVFYKSGVYDMVLQFRQSDSDTFVYGVSMPAGIHQNAMEDPPITGVWGADARPPEEEG